MNLFRSEEHLGRWLAGRPAGAVIPARQLRELAFAWYAGRLAAGWQPRTLAQSQAILSSAGLTSDFWRLG